MSEIQRNGDWLETFTGIKFHVMQPSAEEVCIEDIAHALSMIPRFGGQARRFYSVAAHSLHVLSMALRHSVADVKTERGSRIARYCLLHDAAEAYLGDMVRPLKLSMPDYRAAEERVFDCILARFGLSRGDEPHFLKTIDNMALATEARDLVLSGGTEWRLGVIPDFISEVNHDSPGFLEQGFIDRYTSLCEGK